MEYATMEIGTYNTTFGGNIFIQENCKKDKQHISDKLSFIVMFLKIKGYKPYKHFEINATSISVYKEVWLEIKSLMKKLNVAIY